MISSVYLHHRPNLGHVADVDAGHIEDDAVEVNNDVLTEMRIEPKVLI